MRKILGHCYFRYSFRIVGIFYLSTTLLACSSERTANKENFKNVLNAKFHQNNLKICFTHKRFRFPVAISRKIKSDAPLIAKLDALNSVGLLVRKSTLIKANHMGRKLKMNSAFNYRLTGSGYEASKRIRSDKKWIRKFCYANSHVKNIVNFSNPKPNKNITTTQVSYTLTLTKVSKWALSRKILNAFPSVNKKISLIKNPAQRQTVLKLGKKRWIIVK